MAIGFGSLGTGSTDRVFVNTAANTGTQRTIAFICSAAGLGGGSFGRAMDQGNLSIAKSSTTKLRLQRNWSTTNGQWDVDLAFNETASFVWTYDWASTSNNARCWKNGTEITVTQALVPSGTPVTINGNCDIGNWTAGTRNWDGWIARFAVWTSILPDTACASISKGFSPSKYSPSTIDFYLPMLKLGRDVSRNNRTTTVTGTAFQTHPRVLGGYR